MYSYQHYQPPPQPIQQFPYSASTQLGQLAGSPGVGPYGPPAGGQGKPQPPFSAIGALGGPAGTGYGFGSASITGVTGGDFELFGPSPSPPQPTQQSLYRPPFAQPSYPPPPPQPQSQQYPYAISIPPSSSSSRSSISSARSGDYPSLPDLVPSNADSPSSHVANSPPSPRFLPSLTPRPSLNAAPNSFLEKGLGAIGAAIERPASTPVPDKPKLVKRKTQEQSGWPSFYSSGSSSTSSSSSGAGYMPFAPQQPQPKAYTEEPAEYSTSSTSTPIAAQGGFDPASLALSPVATQYSSFAHHQLPHTDHPLLPSEQSDLLSRVRRDLLEQDVDLSSIKGPLRALALGGGERDATPTPTSLAAQLTPKALPTRSPAVSALSAEDALSGGTVSPQEAFLDYNEVDSRLHLAGGAGGIAGGEFGVGVGGSLFAPLPSSVPHQQTQPYPLPPHAQSSPLRTSQTQPSGSPTSEPTALLPPHASRPPHPFSVPQNAVHWALQRSKSGKHLLGGTVDGDADDDDGDFTGEPSTEEDEEGVGAMRMQDEVRKQARLGEGFGRFEKEEMDLKDGVTGRREEEKSRYGGEPAVKEEEDDFLLPDIPFSFSTDAPSSNDQAVNQDDAPLFSTAYTPQAAPPAQPQQSLSFAPPPPAVSATRLPALPPLSSVGGAATPRRTAAASALSALGNSYPPPPVLAFAPAPAPAYAPTAGGLASTAPRDSPVRPQRQRKRSRLARGADDDIDGEAGQDDADYAPPPAASASVSAEEGAGGGDESDASYHSSVSSSFSTSAATTRRSNTSSSAPPTKRRRRQPNSSLSAAAGPNAIRCDHVNADGSQCGVAFRRPYDLNRHKESIHGEGVGGEKMKSKEWVCAQCNGTFSRKDALLRHSRLRGHKAGV
ncbi:hypothetical protein JCM11641_005483 [Rhodosporidiobolus odoratus]